MQNYFFRPAFLLVISANVVIITNEGLTLTWREALEIVRTQALGTSEGEKP
jgi:hypothetical protein